MTWGSHRRPTPVQPFPRASVPPVGVCRKHTGRAPRSVSLFLGGWGSPLWGSDPTPPIFKIEPYGLYGPASSPLCQAALRGPAGRAPLPCTLCAKGAGLCWPPLSPTTLRGAALRHAPHAAAASYLRYSHTYIHTYIHTYTYTLTFIVLSPYSIYLNSLPRPCTGPGTHWPRTMHLSCFAIGPRDGLQ